MFAILVTYVKPLAEIDALLEDHVRFLDKHFADGTFLAAGRQVPRAGGVILARSGDRPALERLLAQDPFAVHGAATYQVVEFLASRTAPDLAQLRDEA